jgi:hypothetical protein
MELPLIIYAWQVALQQGLGKEHAKVLLQTILFEPGQLAEHVIYNSQGNTLLAEPQFEHPSLVSVEHLKIQLLTPLRIQQRGKELCFTLNALCLLCQC